jgi:protein TonB
MTGRPSLLCLGASIAVHGALLAPLFLLVSDESYSSPLIIDLSALEASSESEGKLGTRSERPATAGARGSGPKRAGAEQPVARIAAAPAPPMPASPAPVVAPSPEPVRPPEREVPVSKPESREPEPAPVAAAAPREPAPDTVTPSLASPSAVGTSPAATSGSSADGVAGRTATQSSATSGATSGGSGSRVALAPGGTGGEPGSEYGGYLLGVRRRIQESIQYPTSARRRGIKGTVNLEILIRADGAISSVSVAGSSSHSELDEAAVEAVRSLAPQPFPAGLKPRPLKVKLPVVFDLQ